MGAAGKPRCGTRAFALGVLTAAAATVAAPTRAGAQIHWDASAQGGAVKRWLGDRPAGGDDAGFGPAAQLAAHVALLPLVRLGAYGAFDVTGAGDATRAIAAGGLRAKILSPWPRGDARAWIFAGFGFAGAWSPSHASRAGVPLATGAGTELREGDVRAAGGRFFEVPLGVGAAWKVWGPVSLAAELAVRIGFAHGGSLYEPPGRTFRTYDADGTSGRTETHLAPAGLDRVALGLTVGVLYDR